MQWLLSELRSRAVFAGGPESGVSTSEYAIMMVLIALAVVTAGGATGVDEAVVNVFVIVQDTILS